MSGFDAIGHSFSTVAIGGFSTHDASMGFFDSRPDHVDLRLFYGHLRPQLRPALIWSGTTVKL